MIIINADDWGRSIAETDAALLCHRAGRITSVSAMLFMKDSERAARLANQAGMDVGLHLNLSQRFTGEFPAGPLREYHDRIVNFLTRNRYSLILFNPTLRKQFRYVYEAQIMEFMRLYGRSPSHIDGHHHKHLCANILLDGVIPAGARVRRNFSFYPGEKSILNRSYRKMVDRWLVSRYRVTDYFFGLAPCLQNDGLTRVVDLAALATVELMAHPASAKEFACLMSDDYLAKLSRVEKGNYSALKSLAC